MFCRRQGIHTLTFWTDIDANGNVTHWSNSEITSGGSDLGVVDPSSDLLTLHHTETPGLAGNQLSQGQQYLYYFLLIYIIPCGRFYINTDRAIISSAWQMGSFPPPTDMPRGAPVNIGGVSFCLLFDRKRRHSHFFSPSFHLQSQHGWKLESSSENVDTCFFLNCVIWETHMNKRINISLIIIIIIIITRMGTR